MRVKVTVDDYFLPSRVIHHFVAVVIVQIEWPLS
jgi:hypothetical protein